MRGGTSAFYLLNLCIRWLMLYEVLSRDNASIAFLSYHTFIIAMRLHTEKNITFGLILFFLIFIYMGFYVMIHSSPLSGMIFEQYKESNECCSSRRPAVQSSGLSPQSLFQKKFLPYTLTILSYKFYGLLCSLTRIRVFCILSV